jgi:hypothetical protein
VIGATFVLTFEIRIGIRVGIDDKESNDRNQLQVTSIVNDIRTKSS